MSLRLECWHLRVTARRLHLLDDEEPLDTCHPRLESGAEVLQTR
jgi:hypothetical protein